MTVLVGAFLYIAFWAILLVLVVFFGIRAYQKRKSENFEKRDY